ncbi:MAG TPA: hypothetical protein DCE41_25455 [Cytophagales bacterium]|nr:hypothetical protein [Cytophagales bacterium]HAA20820.1 hypothetical protein [Cytophagales bacterium]HAP59108.1 hypothetical protein [Cytophagales bacterium]
MPRPNALFSVILLIYACQPPGSDTQSSNEEPVLEDHLVYLSSRGQGFNLYRSDLYGTKEIQLTDAFGWEWMPQFVPGKDMLVYNAQDTVQGYRQEAMDMAGNPVGFDAQSLEGIYVSPGGDWVAWTHADGEDGSFLHITRLSHLSDSLTVGFEGAYNGRPKWSPQSDQLLFLSDESGSNELYLYSLVDSSTTRLTNNGLREKYTAWFPDGQRVLTTISEGGEIEVNEVFQIDLDTKDVTQLTHNHIHEQEIALSVSGRYLAYHGTIGEADDIFVIDLATDSTWAITNNQGYNGEPCWIALPRK